MAAKKKVGDLIKEARAKAGLSQEKLAGMIEGLSASELSKAERGEKELTEAELRSIAKICGVTQKSLLEAASGATAATAAKKPAASSSTAAKKPASTAAKKPAASSSTAAKKPASTAAKKPAAATVSVKVTAAEKRVLELYRAADAAARRNAEAVLKGTKQVQEDGGNLVGNLLGGALEALTGMGKK